MLLPRLVNLVIFFCCDLMHIIEYIPSRARTLIVSLLVVTNIFFFLGNLELFLSF